MCSYHFHYADIIITTFLQAPTSQPFIQRTNTQQTHMPHWLEVLSLPARLRDHVETLVSVCGGGAQAIRPQYLSHHQSLAAQGKGNGSQAHIPVTYQILPTPITSCGLHHNQHIVQNKQTSIKSLKKQYIYFTLLNPIAITVGKGSITSQDWWVSHSNPKLIWFNFGKLSRSRSMALLNNRNGEVILL